MSSPHRPGWWPVTQTPGRAVGTLSVFVFAAIKGWSFLPGQLDGELPGGVQFLVDHYGGLAWVDIYAGAWLLVAALALLALSPSPRAPGWLLPTASLAIASSGFYAASWLGGVIDGTHRFERAWATSSGYLTFGAVVVGFVLLAMAQPSPHGLVPPLSEGDGPADNWGC